MQKVNFSFMCGRHPLPGTYEQQAKAYKRVSEIRERMEQEGVFAEIELNEQQLSASDLWLLKMDLVWEEYAKTVT